MFSILHQDIHQAMRGLLKRPLFTAIAVATLALGIGANAAIFSIVNAVVLRPLPYRDSEKLLVVGPTQGDEIEHVGEPFFLFVRDHQRTMDALALYQRIGSGINLSDQSTGQSPEFVEGLRISRGFFDVLGVSPSLGRDFAQEEDQRGGPPVTVISHELKQRRFAAEQNIIGRTLAVNGREHTIIGVLPSGFQFFNDADVYVPYQASLAGDVDPNALMIGRSKTSASMSDVLQDLNAIGQRFRAENPRELREPAFLSAQRAQDYLARDVRRNLFILLGAVGFVLLIACANVANLQLARAADRRRELAVRIALGAGTKRIVSLLLIDGVLLAFFGGLAGLMLASWGTDALKAFIPAEAMQIVGEVSLDWRVATFTLLTAVATGIAFGLAPLSQILSIDINHALKEGGGRGGAQGRGWLRTLLVVSEIGLAVVLLVSAVLLIRTFANLNKVNPGFDPHGVLTFQVSPMGERYKSGAQIAAFYDQTIENLRRIPGVEGVAVTSTLPLSSQFRMPLEVAGRDPIAESIQLRVVSADYFQTMRMPLIKGQFFSSADTSASEPVIIINEAFAQRYLSQKDWLGERVAVGRRLESPRRVLGVVGSNKQQGLGSESPATVYIPLGQTPDKLWPVLRRFVSMRFVARASSASQYALANSIRQGVSAVDPGIPVTSLRTMDEILSRSLASQKFNMILLVLFAGLGLFLTAIGIYGVMAYLVSQRTREVGIRIALGAQASDVFKLVIGEGMLLAALGVILGLAVSLGTARVIRGFLFEVSATDPISFVAIAAVILSVAFIACWLPAKRATGVDPLIALRCE